MSKPKLYAIILAAMMVGFLAGRINFSGGFDELDPVFSRYSPLQDFLNRTFGQS